MPNGVTIGHQLARAGRELTHDEFETRLDLAPEKAEWDGGIYTTQHQRATVLAMLLELLGTDAAVAFGSLDVWEASVAARRAGQLDAAVAAEVPDDPERAATTARVLAVLAAYADGGRRGRAYGPDAAFPAIAADVAPPSAAFVAGPVSDAPAKPDLAVIVTGIIETCGQVAARVKAYRAAGAAAVWVVTPGGYEVDAYPATGDRQWVGRDQELTAESVLPGFRCRAGDLLGSREGPD